MTISGEETSVARRWLSRRYKIVALFLLYLLMSLVTWHRSGDLLVDWGRELYTAWRLSDGAVLYRDVSSLFGPLASYFNAFLFSVFGVSASVIQAANVLGIGLLSLLIYDVFRRISGHPAAALAAYLFLSVFAFAYMTEAGIFNFVTPYSHDATLGLGLCVALVWSIMRVERRPTVVSGLVVGLTCGLAWLTKPEIALAAVVTLGVGAVLLGRRVNRPGVSVWVAVFCGVVLPSTAAILAFTPSLGLSRALTVPLEGVRSASAARAWDIPFYHAVSGLARPWRNLGIVVGSALAVFLFFGALEALERHLPSEKSRRIVGASLLSVGALVLVVFMDAIPWLETARPLPVLTAVVWVLAVAQAWKAPQREEATTSSIGLACWSTLSLALLMKVALLARFYHFGFYLVLPAALLLAVVLVYRLPGWLPASSGQFTRGFAILLVGAISANALGIEVRQYRARSFQIETAGDRMNVFQPYVDPRAFTVSEAMDVLRGIAAEITTVLVLPEGAMLNYWLRLPTPTPQLSFMPPEVARFGEDEVQQALLKTPPDVVVITERSLAEYGSDGLGKSLNQWIRADYCLLTLIQARAEDFPASESLRPAAVAHPSHSIAVHARKDLSLCSQGS